MRELFLVMLCNQKVKGLFAMFVAIKNGVKSARIFVEKVSCFNVE